MSTPTKTPTSPSTPSPARLLALTADDPYDDRVEDILKLSLIPDPAHDKFRSMVTSVDDLMAADESALTILVEELSTVHQPLATSPFKKKILLNNLIFSWRSLSVQVVLFGQTQPYWSRRRLSTPRASLP
jgi:hypothetical protein